MVLRFGHIISEFVLLVWKVYEKIG
jgi:hypothetical protein